MQALGFNTIKLPFSFDSLLGTNPGTYSRSCSLPASDFETMNGLIESRVGVAKGATVPTVTPTGATTCNSEIPTSSPMARFNWVIHYFAANGFYVVRFLLAPSDWNRSYGVEPHIATLLQLGSLCMRGQVPDGLVRTGTGHLLWCLDNGLLSSR